MIINKKLLIIYGLVLTICMVFLIVIVCKRTKEQVCYSFDSREVPVVFESEGSLLSFVSNGQIQVFQSEVLLDDGDFFHLSFDLEGDDIDGGLVYIDLYADGYDNQESECRYSATKDIYHIECDLPFGKKHPESCLLRIFSLGDVNATISNIQIDRLAYSFSIAPFIFKLLVLFSAFLFTIIGLRSDSKRSIPFMLAGIVILQVLLVSFWAFQKTNLYVDELYALGGAHRYTSVAKDSGYIYEQWSSNTALVDDIRKRLMIGERESILDQSLVENLKLFFIGRNYFGFLNLVETISGRGGIHVIPAIILNVILVIITELVLFMLLKKIGVDNGLSLLAVFWYGFCGMTVSNELYIRFYTLAIMFFILSLYFHALMWDCNDPKKWVGYGMIAMLCFYFGFMNSELVFPLAVMLVLFFTIALLIRRKWLQAVVYVIPITTIGGIYVALMTPFFEMLLHSDDFIERALLFTGGGDIDRTDEMVYIAHFSDVDTVLLKLKQCFDLIKVYIFGNIYVLSAMLFLIVLVVGFAIYNKIRKNANSYGDEELAVYDGFVFVLMLVLLSFTAFHALAMNVLMRYYSFSCVMIIVIIVYLLGRNKGIYKSFISAVAALIVLVGCINIHLSPNIDYLYLGDEVLHDTISDYRDMESLLVMDTPSFQRSVYEAVYHLDDNARIRQLYVDGEIAKDSEGIIKESELDDRLLLWIFPNQEVSEELRWISKSGYKYKVIANNSAAEVYLCER